jgi:hypothetical protein
MAFSSLTSSCYRLLTLSYTVPEHKLMNMLLVCLIFHHGLLLANLQLLHDLLLSNLQLLYSICTPFLHST